MSSKKNTPQSKNRRSRLPQNSSEMNFSPQDNFALTGVSPQQQRGIRFRPSTLDYETQLPQPNQNQNLFSLNRPFIPPQRMNMDYQQEPSGSAYRPNMDFLHDSQPYQEYSPIRSGNLEMNLEDWGEYPSQQYSTQNYPSQDASMGQASGHGSYHGSMPVEDDYEEYVEEVSPIKPKKPTKRATKAKGKAPVVQPSKKPAPWSKTEELALCRAFIFISENDLRGNAMHRHNFWELVIDYFRKETGSDRTYDSILSKWKTRIRAPVASFCAIMDNINQTHGSG